MDEIYDSEEEIPTTDQMYSSYSPTCTKIPILMDEDEKSGSDDDDDRGGASSLLEQYRARIAELELENARLMLRQIEINTAKELYLKIFEDFPALIWRSGLDKQCDYFNKTWLEWTGKTMEQEYGTGWAKGVHADDFDQCLETYVTAFDKREYFYMEYRLMNKEGEYRWIGDHGQPFFDLDGTFLGYIGSCYDIHDNKLNEQGLVEAKEKAISADKLKSAFLTNMSHEIRTPLNGVIGHIDLALANGLSPTNQDENLEGLKIAKNSGELLISIIQDILDLSKIEAGQLDISSDETFSIGSIVGHTESLASTILHQRKKENVRFVTNVEPGISDSIQGDCFRLQQVINNLVSNAVKFTTKGKIELSVSICQDDDDEMLDDEMIEITVSDTGKGIPKSHIKSIFEPFRQVEVGDTRQHGGTGLGLTISRRLVEMMGGTLSVKSTVSGPNTGSSFSFRLPYRPVEDTQRSTITNNQAVVESSPKNLGPVQGKIMIAEDDKVSRRLAHRVLTKAGFDVVLAEDGEEALSLYQSRNDVALILMDVQMPRLDGMSATKRIRSIEHANHVDPIPIIALSAGAMKGDEQRGLDSGMTSYLTKPLNLKLVIETVEQYVGRNNGDHENREMLPHPLKINDLAATSA